MAANPAAIAKNLSALKARRSIHERVWRDCYDHTWPIRGSGLNSTTLTAEEAQSRKADILDGVGTDSARILASGIMGGNTPNSSQWLGYEIAGQTDEEGLWFEEVADIVWRNIHASNYDSAGFEALMDIVAAGWCNLYVDAAPEGGYNFDLWPLAQCYVSASKAGGLIDTIYREYELTAEQALSTFGNALSEKTRALAESKPFDLVRFCHAIYPRVMYREGSPFALELPFASCNIELAARLLVRESGYHEFPVVVSRWSLIPASAYAVGPTFDALPDLKMLQQLKGMELAAADVAISGMWGVVDDGVINTRTVRIGPGKAVVVASKDSIFPLQTGADFNVAFTAEERLHLAIRRIFMADQLEPMDGPQKTATEIHVRVALIRQLLGPVYGRFLSEYVKPLASRCFGLAMRAGALPQPPQSLRGRFFQVRYRSPFALAQSLEEVTAMDRMEQALGAASAVKPDVLDLYDWDQAERERARLLGVKKSLMRDEDAVAQIRKKRADAEAQAQQQAALQDAMSQAPPAQRAGAVLAGAAG